MEELIFDENGIWTMPRSEAVSYPDMGNMECMKLEDNSFWFRHRNEIIYTITRRFPFQNNFADIGGGNGYQSVFLTNRYLNKKFFLIEPGYEGCLNARRRKLENVYNIFFQNFPFQENKIGAVGLFDVIEHLQDDKIFLKELLDRLPKGAMIYITVPAFNGLWSDADNDAGHFRRYTLRSLKKLADVSGVETIFSSYFFSYLTPLIFLLRSLPYRLGRRRKSEKTLEENQHEHKPSKIVNFLFKNLNSFESKLLHKAVIPVGGSCISVFKKHR